MFKRFTSTVMLPTSVFRTTITRYFPDRKFAGAKQSLAAAEKTLAELKALIAGSKFVDGKLGAATIKKAGKHQNISCS